MANGSFEGHTDRVGKAIHELVWHSLSWEDGFDQQPQQLDVLGQAGQRGAALGAIEVNVLPLCNSVSG